MRLIDADALENMGYELQRIYQQDANTMVYEVKKIADVPTVEAEPVRYGRWVKKEKVYPYAWYTCSECGCDEIHGEAITVAFCWNCGAKMEENNG